MPSAAKASDGWPEVREAYAAGDLPRCEALLDALPETSLVRLWQIRLAGRESRWEAVRDLASAYLDENPSNVEVTQALARAANKLKDVPLAARFWRRLAEIAPDPAEALRQSARANAKVANDIVALDAAGRLATIAEARPEVVSIAVRTLLDLDQFEALAALVAHVAADQPGTIETLVEQFARDDERRGLATVLAGLRRRASAIPAAIDEATVLERLLTRAVRYERDGQLVDALGDFRAILILSPEEALAQHGVERLKGKLLDQARALNRIGAFDEAITSLRLMYRTDPANPEVAVPFGRALLIAGQFEPALAVWRGVLADDPGREEAAVQVARALEWLDRPAEAIAAWSALRHRWPANAEAVKHRRKLAQTLYRLGRDALAAEDGVSAAAHLAAVPADSAEGPGAAERLERVGRVLLKSMRADYKAREFDRLVRIGLVGRELAPDLLDLHRLLAKGAAKVRLHDIALTGWERVAALQDSTEARVEIARQRLALGDTAGADTAVAEALALDPAAAGVSKLRAQIAAAGGSGATATADATM